MSDLVDVSSDAVIGGIGFAVEFESFVAVVQHETIKYFVSETIEGFYLLWIPSELRCF